MNTATPLAANVDQVDKVLIEMGLPLNEHLVNWNFNESDERSYTYAPVDTDTRQTLIELERKRDQAFKVQDYELLQALSQDLKIVFEVRISDWPLSLYRSV